MQINEQALREEIIEELGLGKLNVERQDALIDKAVTALLERIFLESMKKIGEAGVREYEALIERETEPEEVEQFFEAKIPGYNTFVRALADQFKEELKKAQI